MDDTRYSTKRHLLNHLYAVHSLTHVFGVPLRDVAKPELEYVHREIHAHAEEWERIVRDAG